MKINSTQAAQQKRQIQDLVKDQRAEIIQKQSEINNIEKLYDKKVEAKKVEGERELVEAQDLNQKNLIEAVDGQSEKLEQLRTNLTSTKDMLDKEHGRLVKTHQEQIQDTNNFYNDKYQRQFIEGEDLSKEINNKVNDHVKDVEAQTERNILKSQSSANLRLDGIEHQNELKVKNIDQNYNSARNRMEVENSRMLNSIEKDHKKKMNDRLGGQVREAELKTQIHADQLKNQELYYTDIIKQKDLSFKQKLETMTKDHEQVISNMKSKYQAEFEQIVKDHSQTKKVAEEKVKDPFYQVEVLDPKIQDMGDSYLVSIEIPESELDSVNVSAGKRKISVAFARRFQERLESKESGEVYHSARSEGHRKEIPVKDIVDSHHIEQKYADGVLTYKIKKA